jgi:hypothetical protein
MSREYNGTLDITPFKPVFYVLVIERALVNLKLVAGLYFGDNLFRLHIMGIIQNDDADVFYLAA